MAASTSVMPRFQRSRCFSTPRSAFELNSNCASSNAFGKSLAYELTKWKRHVCLPGRERLAVEELCAVANGCRLVHDESCASPRPTPARTTFQSTLGTSFLSPDRSIGLIDLADLALALRRPGNGGDLVLDADHLFCGAGRILVPEQLEDLRDVRGIRRAIGVELFALLQVVVAVGHAKPRLTDPHRVPRRIHRVWVDGHAERRLKIDRAHEPHQAGPVLDRIDLRQEGLQRFESACLDPSFVHPAGIQVGDLLLHAAR